MRNGRRRCNARLVRLLVCVAALVVCWLVVVASFAMVRYTGTSDGAVYATLRHLSLAPVYVCAVAWEVCSWIAGLPRCIWDGVAVACHWILSMLQAACIAFASVVDALVSVACRVIVAVVRDGWRLVLWLLARLRECIIATFKCAELVIDGIFLVAAWFRECCANVRWLFGVCWEWVYAACAMDRVVHAWYAVRIMLAKKHELVQASIAAAWADVQASIAAAWALVRTQ